MVTMDGVRSATVQLSAGFWRDVQWWRDHIGERFSVPWEMPEEAEAVLSGTDASGWGTGQLAWIDGAREEIVLRFNRAEQRRPINWPSSCSGPARTAVVSPKPKTSSTGFRPRPRRCLRRRPRLHPNS